MTVTAAPGRRRTSPSVPTVPVAHRGAARRSSADLTGRPSAGLVLLAQARCVLDEARGSADAGERFRLAHLSALRAAAALVAERGRPDRLRRRLISVWVLIESVAPEHRDWATYFAAGAAARAAIEAGAVAVVNDRDADDQLRAAGEFLAVVETSFGLLAA